MGERWRHSGAEILSHLEILSSLTAERRNDDPLSERQARPKDASGTDHVPVRRFAFRDAPFSPQRSLPRLVSKAAGFAFSLPDDRRPDRGGSGGIIPPDGARGGAPQALACPPSTQTLPAPAPVCPPSTLSRLRCVLRGRALRGTAGVRLRRKGDWDPEARCPEARRPPSRQGRTPPTDPAGRSAKGEPDGVPRGGVCPATCDGIDRSRTLGSTASPAPAHDSTDNAFPSSLLSFSPTLRALQRRDSPFRTFRNVLISSFFPVCYLTFSAIRPLRDPRRGGRGVPQSLRGGGSGHSASSAGGGIRPLRDPRRGGRGVTRSPARGRFRDPPARRRFRDPPAVGVRDRNPDPGAAASARSLPGSRKRPSQTPAPPIPFPNCAPSAPARARACSFPPSTGTPHGA